MRDFFPFFWQILRSARPFWTLCKHEVCAKVWEKSYIKGGGRKYKGAFVFYNSFLYEKEKYISKDTHLKWEFPKKAMKNGREKADGVLDTPPQTLPSIMPIQFSCYMCPPTNPHLIQLYIGARVHFTWLKSLYIHSDTLSFSRIQYT